MAKYLRIVEWAKYQHYKDRNPPWIKLHGELLHSYTWTCLDDASRLLAVVCMLLASQTENKIPLDRDYIQRRALLNKRPDVRPLVDVGFAEVFEDQLLMDDASKVLQGASKLQADARPETEAETEAETEIPKKKRASQLPEQWIPKAGHYQLAKELNLLVEKQLPSFRDHFLGTGAVKLDWDATFRNWLRRASEYGGRNGSDRRNNQEQPQPHVTAQHQRQIGNILTVLGKHGMGAAVLGSQGPGSTGVGTQDGAVGSVEAARHQRTTGGVVEGEIKGHS